MSRPRKIRNKFYISFEDAVELNEDLKTIFSNVTLFQAQGFTARKLFTAFNYEYGTRLLNYGFSIQNGRVVVPDEAVEDITTYVDMFVNKFQTKYAALLESESFQYNPLDNVDIAENRDITRTPNLSGSVTDTGSKSSTRTDNLSDKETRNLTDTIDGTTTRTDNLTENEWRNLTDKTHATSKRTDDLTDTEIRGMKDEVNTHVLRTDNLSETSTYGSTLTKKDKTEYHSGTDTTTKTEYGKTETHTTTSDISTNSVVPYDSSNFSDREKNTHTDTSKITTSGEDKVTTGQDNNGYDEKSGGEVHTGSDTVANTGTQENATNTTTTYTGADTFTHTGTQKNEADTEDTHTGNQSTTNTGTQSTDNDTTTTHTGTDEFKHTGTQQISETNGLTRTTSSTGTETTDDDFTRTGFQPQYSISSRQDMIQKYRDISNFSAVDIFLHDVADYILLSVFSTSPNLDCCLNNYL